MLFLVVQRIHLHAPAQSLDLYQHLDVHKKNKKYSHILQFVDFYDSQRLWISK